MTSTYEFRIFRQTQRVHIFEAKEGDAPETSLCGEIKKGFTLPDCSEPLDAAKKYAMDNSYTCRTCAGILAKRI